MTRRMNGLTRAALVVGLVVSIPTALVWPTGIAAGLVAHFEQVAANSNYIQLVQYKLLSEARKSRRLTFEEWVTFCKLGKALGFFTVCPARR